MSRIFQLPRQVPLVSGAVSPGAKANFFLTTTTTPTDTYTDAALTTPHTNPVIADAAGVFATIYLDPDVVYKLTLDDTNDALIYTEDPIQDALTRANIGLIFYPKKSPQEDGITIVNFFEFYGNALRYGAVGEGTDDHAAILAVFAYSAQSGDWAYFPNGVYGATDNIVPISGTRIRGDGMYQSTIKLISDIGTKVISAEGVSNIEIKDIEIDSQSSVYSTVRTVIQFNFTTGGSNIRFRRVKIPGSDSAGIVCDKTDGVTVEGCEISNCVAGDALRISNTGANDIKVINNSFLAMDSLAENRRVIQIGTATNFLVKGNTIEDAVLTYVYDFGGSSKGLVTGDVVSNCLRIADLEAVSSNIAFTGNTFNGTATDNGAALGIAVLENPSGDTCNGLVITGNSIQGFYHGVRIEGGRQIAISGNVIQECFAHGISVTDGAISSKLSNNISIIGNTVSNCSKSGAGSFDGIGIKADRGVVAGNFVRGTNHRFDINSNSSNALVHIGVNYADTINRGETTSYVRFSDRRIYEGSVNPEGTVTASPGDIYLRSTGGGGTTFNIKEFGTDTNTGWSKSLSISTTTALEDIADLINTSPSKVEGREVFNTTTNIPVWAAGDADGDVWVNATGATAHTPVV